MPRRWPASPARPAEPWSTGTTTRCRPARPRHRHSRHATGGTLVSTVTVTGGVVPPSAAATFPAAGIFFWAAFYSGDPSNQAATSHCVTEPLVATPAASQVSTQLSAVGGEIAVGGSASDSATLTGVTGTAGGTVAYRYYDSLSACQTRRARSRPASGGTLVSTVTVTGGVVPPSAAATFPAAGTFYWAAFYSGDGADRRRPATAPPSRWWSRRAIAGHDSVVGRGRGDNGRRVGERLRDPARRHRHGGRDRGVPVLRLSLRLPDRDIGIPRTGPRRHAGVDGDGHRRRGAALGRRHVPRRGHLLLGRVLLRRCRRPGGGQQLRHRAARSHAGAATSRCHGHRPYGLGDRRRAPARSQPGPGFPGQPVAQPAVPAGRARDAGGRNGSATSSGRTFTSP